MSKQEFIMINSQLSSDFDNYIAHHPKLWARLPKSAFVYMTVAGNDEFNEFTRSLTLKRRSVEDEIVEARKGSNGRWTLRPVAT